MTYFLVIFISLLVSGAFAFIFHRKISATQGGTREGLEQVEQIVQQRLVQKEQLAKLYESMVDLGTLQDLAHELYSIEEALKAERGRITITQAELETVEGRLRELEEIERELEASGLETKEELNILQKKQAELESKNQSLKKKLNEAVSQIDQLLQELQDNAAATEKIVTMKTQLLQTEERVNTLLVQIEEGNEQYFILKRRYDALDIEYAQLYEKFSELDAVADKANK